MRRLTRSLLAIALVVGIGIALIAWLGAGLDGSAGPDAPSTTSSGGVPDGAIAATVRHIHDGDTLFLSLDGASEELKVRLIGIDTPEIGDRAECFGEEARDRLRELLPAGARVLVLAEAGAEDRYGRSLLHVFLPDGVHVNLLLIEEGLAETMFFDPNRDYETPFRAAEAEAAAEGLGLWGACGR